jgi:hypothetical protein
VKLKRKTILSRIHVAAIDGGAWILLSLLIASVACAQPGRDRNGWCYNDPATGQTICTDGVQQWATPTQGTGSDAPSAYRSQSVPAQFACHDGGNGNGRQPPLADWRRWADETEKRIKQLEGNKQDRGEYLTPTSLEPYAKKADVPAVPKDQATQGFVEQRLKQIGAALDHKLVDAETDIDAKAKSYAATALAAAKEDAGKLVPGILNAARTDAEQRFKAAAPTLLATLTQTIDARFQNVSVGAVAGFGMKHLLFAAGAGATGTVPAYLLARLAMFGFSKLFRRGRGGPRDGSFRSST